MVPSLVRDIASTLDSPAPAECVTDMIGMQTATIDAARVGVVTLSRPDQLNALSLAGWKRITLVLIELSADPLLRAIVVRGAGARAFSAGADISEFPTLRSDAETARTYNAAIATALLTIQSLPVPVIAIVAGLAVGGGCELAAACDSRIASADSRFGIPIGKLGVTLGLTETRAVAAAIGPANLKFLIYSGKLITANRARKMGLVQDVVDRDELVNTTVALVRNIAASSETTVRVTKTLTRLASDAAATEDDEPIATLSIEAYGGSDLREGVDAFLSGRSARFAVERSTANGRA